MLIIEIDIEIFYSSNSKILENHILIKMHVIYIPELTKLKILKNVCGMVRSPQNSSPYKYIYHLFVYNSSLTYSAHCLYYLGYSTTSNNTCTWIYVCNTCIDHIYIQIYSQWELQAKLAPETRRQTLVLWGLGLRVLTRSVHHTGQGTHTKPQGTGTEGVCKQSKGNIIKTT